MNKVNLEKLHLGKSVIIDAEHWPYESHAQLQHFSLTDVALTEIEVETIIRSSAMTLRYLNIQNIRSIGSSVGRALETCRNLRTLRVFFYGGVDNESIANFLQTNQSLEALTIGGSLLRMSLHDPLIRFGGHLRELELLPCTSTSSWNFVVSDFDLIAFASGLSNLQRLALTTVNATDFGMESLAKLTDLRSLQLSSPTLRDTGLVTFVNNVTGLVKLDISNCPKLTDVSVIESAIKQTKLHSLSARNCPLLTDASVEVLISNAKALAEVDFSYCSNISASCEIRLQAGLVFAGPKKIVFAQHPQAVQASGGSSNEFDSKGT